MTKSRILFVNGTPDNYIVQIKRISRKGIEHVNPGNCDLFHFLNSDHMTKAIFHLDINPTSSINLPQDISLIVNQISNADSHTKSLRKLSQRLSQYQDIIPVLNLPEQVLNTRRELIYQQLNKLPDLYVPKTIRIQPHSPTELINLIDLAEISFPAFICEVATHEKHAPILLRDKDSALELYTLAMDGRDFYLTQSIDCEEMEFDFVYRIIVIDGVPFLRHVRRVDQHKLNHHDYKAYLASHPESIQKEEKMFQDFEQKIKPRLQKHMIKIHQQVKLDFFGVDCCLLSDGQLLVFEVNANILDLNHLMPHYYYTHALEKLRSSVLKLLFNRIGG